MNELVLTPEQVASLAGPIRAVVVKSPDGQELGKILPPLTPEQIAELKARVAAAKNGPWFSGDQIKAQMAALNSEWARVGPFDREYMFAFLAKLSESAPETYGPTG